jgi:hypothetical protein
MDRDGNVYTASDLGITQSNWQSILTQTYKGEALASNQNVNKGIFNSDFSSVVTVYSYDADGNLIGSMGYEVETPEGENLADGTIVTALKDGRTFTLGTVTGNDGSRTETVLTVYEGKYLALSGAIKSISDHIMGLVEYFDATENE